MSDYNDLVKVCRNSDQFKLLCTTLCAGCLR